MFPIIPFVTAGVGIYGAIKLKGWYDDVKRRNLELINHSDDKDLREIFLSPRNIISDMLDDIGEKIDGIEDSATIIVNKIDRLLEDEYESKNRQQRAAASNIIKELDFSSRYTSDIAREALNHISKNLPLDGLSCVAMLLELESSDKIHIKDSLNVIGKKYQESLKIAQDEFHCKMDDLKSKATDEVWDEIKEIYHTKLDTKYKEEAKQARARFDEGVKKIYNECKSGKYV